MRVPFGTVLLTVLAFALTLGLTVRVYAVHGSSMEPTLSDGQVVVVNRLAYLLRSPRPGDLVVLEHPLRGQELMIKRISSLQEQNSIVYRGDNPGESVDSRHFGSISRQALRGRVVFIGR